MAQSATFPAHAHVASHSSADVHPGSARSVEPDPGPWLVLLGPVSIALTVLAVSWISKISF